MSWLLCCSWQSLLLKLDSFSLKHSSSPLHSHNEGVWFTRGCINKQNLKNLMTYGQLTRKIQTQNTDKPTNKQTNQEINQETNWKNITCRFYIFFSKALDYQFIIVFCCVFPKLFNKAWNAIFFFFRMIFCRIALECNHYKYTQLWSLFYTENVCKIIFIKCKGSKEKNGNGNISTVRKE